MPRQAVVPRSRRDHVDYSAAKLPEVTEQKGRETRTSWRCEADLDSEMLKGFKAGQRLRRREAGGEFDAAETARRYG